MPSPANAADLKRVLTRAAQECESKRGIWFGDGLPQALRSSIPATDRAGEQQPAELAFVEVQSVSARGSARTEADTSALGCPIIGLSTLGLEDLGSLIHSQNGTGVEIARLICPVAVFDFVPDGVRVREIRHGLTAADLQRKLDTRLWAGPDLKELGTH